jgi:hypothetical protein
LEYKIRNLKSQSNLTDTCSLTPPYIHRPSGGARANLNKVHYLVICIDLTHQGALIVDYRDTHTIFSTDYKVIIKATRVHVHPVGSMQLRPCIGPASLHYKVECQPVLPHVHALLRLGRPRSS